MQQTTPPMAATLATPLMATPARASALTSGVVRAADLVVFGNVQFWTGYLLGSLLDRNVMPPLDRQNGKGRTVLEVGLQVGLCILLWALVRHAMERIHIRSEHYAYDHRETLPMDGGWPLSVGIGWSQRNLLTKLAYLADE